MVSRFFSAGVFKAFLVLTSVVAALVLGSHWFHPCVVPVLPLILPGFLLFGAEWEPQLGVWGALLAGWLISMPGTYLLAWLWIVAASRLAQRKGSGDLK